MWLMVVPCSAMASDGPQIFRTTAPDGTLVFSDRPQHGPGPDNLNETILVRLPQPNLLAPVADVSPQSPPPSINPMTDAAPEAVPNESKNCLQLRRQLTDLWRERRTGYRAERGPELKRSIRERQAELKTRCGQWR